MPDIDALTLTERMDRGETLNLLDVREILEYHTYNIGGLNIPLGQLASHIDELEWNKDEEIIVICKMGLRSKTAQQILKQNGFGRVKNLVGGLMAIGKIKNRL